MSARRLLLAGVLAAFVAACGSNPSSPSNANATQTTACALTNGKVEVVIGYMRDRATVASPLGSLISPSLVLVDIGDGTTSFQSSNPQLTRINDYTWTTTVLVTPNADPMSHGASVIDLAGLDTASVNAIASVVTGVTANGVQVRKITRSGLDLGYFGVDACGRIFV